jgi:sugar porter (SP) family MFS transporter
MAQKALRGRLGWGYIKNKMNKKLILWSITVGLGGLLFGLDTVVISGANLPIKALWHTSPWFHGFFIMSMALWGTVVGSLFGGIPTEVYGRKKVLFWIGILFTVSSVGTAIAPDPYTFSFFRFLGGIAIGASSVTVPTYISEISTSENRGKLVGSYQFNIVFGILIAFVSNYLLKGVGGANDWRWMLGILTIPSVIYTILVMSVPESPRWLIANKNDIEGAEKVLQAIGIKNVSAEIEAIKEAQKSESENAQNQGFFSKKYSKLLFLAFFISFFNQVSGINFILYYAPEILERAGLGAKDSLKNSILIGSTNLIFTFIGLYLIDKLGRKTLLLIGSVGYILSLAAVSWCFYSHADTMYLLTFLLMFIASHAIGQGAIIWVFISEIFPNNIRAFGQAFGCGIHWIFAALITLVTPFFLDEEVGIFKENPYPIFAFFAVMMIFQLIWTLVAMPETKGVSLEDLQKKLMKA